jgi:putative PIN family toxin of toxin-antitoxin system
VKVCLDTNVIVAAFATRGLCADVYRTVVAEHEFVLGEVMLDELRRVLRTKLKLPEPRIALVEAALAGFPVVAKPSAPSPLELRDAADRWILATAVAGAADVLVTGDRGLLAIGDASPLPILTPRAFWDLLRAGHGGRAP